MEQQIQCHRGRCKDVDSIKSRFDEIYDKSDIDNKIELDLLKKSLRRSRY